MALGTNVTLIPARKHVRKVKNDEKPKLRVAAYCRVSTDSDEQATSYEAQIEHYTSYINGNPDWELAGIFADAADIIGLNQNPITTGADLVLFFLFSAKKRGEWRM